MCVWEVTPLSHDNKPTQPKPLTVFTPAPVREAAVCDLCFSFEPAKVSSASREEEADAAGSLPPSTDEPSQALAGSDSLDSPPRPLERSVGQLPSPPLLPTPPPKAGSRTTRSVTGGSTSIHPSTLCPSFSHPSMPPTGPGWAPTVGWFSPFASVSGVLGRSWGAELEAGGQPLLRSLVDRSRDLGSLKQTWGNCQRFLPESGGRRHNHSLSIWVLRCLTVLLCFWVSVCLSLLASSLPPLYLCPSLSSPPVLPLFPAFSFILSLPSLPPQPCLPSLSFSLFHL